jgi:hypothetical protein
MHGRMDAWMHERMDAWIDGGMAHSAACQLTRVKYLEYLAAQKYVSTSQTHLQLLWKIPKILYKLFLVKF